MVLSGALKMKRSCSNYQDTAAKAKLKSDNESLNEQSVTSKEVTQCNSEDSSSDLKFLCIDTAKLASATTVVENIDRHFAETNVLALGQSDDKDENLMSFKNPVTYMDKEEQMSSFETASSLTNDALRPTMNAPGFEIKNPDQSTVNLSDTFIKIETKDGFSTKQIPFLQFMRDMMIDPNSKDLKAQLAQLLKSETGNIKGNANDEQSSGESFPLVTDLDTVCDTNKSVEIEDSKSSLDFTDDSEKQTGNKLHDRKKKVKKSTESSSNEQKNGPIPTMPKLHTKQIATPTLRRSFRTPAKNTRFGDDFVDSGTIVKKSPSSWNAQLMTLALAAERHENVPSDISCSNGSLAESKSKMRKTESNSNKKGAYNADTALSGNKYINAPAVPSSKNVSIRGPKTLKKYQAVAPIAKRSQEDALNIAVTKTKSLLHSDCIPQSEINLKNPIFYTIMEPKLQPTVDALVVKKSTGGLNFKVANFQEAQKNIHEDSYPLERYFSCDLCSEVFPSSNSWLEHNQNIHQRNVEQFEELCKSGSDGVVEKKTYECNSCGQKFPHKFMLDIHKQRKRHNNESKTFRCTLCKLTFSNPKQREEHWIKAHPGRSCALCGKHFTNVVMLRRHINNNCHGARFRKRPATVLDGCVSESAISAGQGAIEEIEQDQSIVLETYNEYINVMNELSNEESTQVYPSENNTLDSENEKIVCDLCGYGFSTHSGLWHHKLDQHHQYIPSNFAGKLKSILERNSSQLLETEHIGTIKEENKGNKYFVIMEPKWPKSKSKVAVSQVSVNDVKKDFVFESKDHDSLIETMDLCSTTNFEGEIDLSKKSTVFNCGECELSFKLASNYRDHRSKAHGECFETSRLLGAFQCNNCSDTFPCEFMLKEHLKKHSEGKRLPCTLCGLEFHKIQERRLHWKTMHPGIGCPNCGKMYASMTFLQKHISLNCQDHFPASKKFIEFRNKQHNDFELRKEEKRVEKKVIKCHLCPKLSSSVHGWRRHMSSKHEDAGFSKLSNTCIICNQVVYGYKALEKHLWAFHAEETGLPVDEENKIVEEALSKSAVDIESYHKADMVLGNKDIVQDEEGFFHCPKCPKTHSDIKALRTHIKTHVDMNLECSLCQKSFKNPMLLKQHIQRHRAEAVYSCETCDKSFLTLQKLNKHRKVHNKNQKHICELCGMSFAQSEYLQKHLRCHTDHRPHVCSICSKTFRTKPELRVHILIHTKEVAYRCEHCGRGFSQKGNYRIHLAQHTGKKPWTCNQCDLSFAMQCHLKRHMKTHDQKINYRCIWCGKECTQRKHMQMHVQRVHKEDFSVFEEQMKLETSLPIAPSQLKLYNRKKAQHQDKVRKQYKTRAQKCDSTYLELMEKTVPFNRNGLKTEQLESNEPLTMEETMIETVTDTSHLSELPVMPADNEHFEILVSDDHQNYVKQNGLNMPPELIGQSGNSNLEIVMGENNQINIIIKDQNTLQAFVGDESPLGVHYPENGNPTNLQSVSLDSNIQVQAIEVLGQAKQEIADAS